MHESGPYSFFRSRWFALMWASLICLSAATFVYGLRENAAAARIDQAQQRQQPAEPAPAPATP